MYQPGCQSPRPPTPVEAACSANRGDLISCFANPRDQKLRSGYTPEVLGRIIPGQGGAGYCGGSCNI
jgi:hypothetical protein